MRANKWAAVAVVVGLVGAALWWRCGGSTRTPTPISNGAAKASAHQPTLQADAPSVPAWFGQPEVPARRIAGVVTFEGKPAAATVTLTSEATLFGVSDQRIRTAADGSFAFAPQVAGVYLVVATSPGRTPASADIDLRDPTADVEDLRLELTACSHRVSGVVRDASGGVIAGATVRPRRWTVRGPPTVTGDDGSYELCAPRDRLGLEFAAAGYGTLMLEIEIEAHVRYDARLVPEAVITGRVESIDGAPIPGAGVSAHIRAWSDLERPGWAATVAGADGAFELHGVGAGEMGIHAVASGWAQVEPALVRTTAGSATAEVVVRMARGATVRGRVLHGQDPVAGAVIGWKPRGQRFPHARAGTQVDGSFVLTNLEATHGELVVLGYEVEAPGELTLESDRTSTAEVSVATKASIVGVVTHEGRPVAGATVELHRPGMVLSLMTGSDGSFAHLDLSPGRHRVQAQSDAVGAFAQPVEVEVEAGQKHRVELDLDGGGRVSGIVVTQAGQPLGGARVRASLVGGADYGAARTQDDGTFEMTMLSGGGRYAFTVEAPSSTTALRPATAFPEVEVGDGRSHTRNVRLVVKAERGTIAGTLVDAHGAPIADARITAEAMHGEHAPFFSGWDRVARTITDADGGFELELYGPAGYAIQARVGSATKTSTGIALGTRDVRLQMDPVGGISGTVVGFARTPTIEVRGLKTSNGGQATAHGGRFRFDDLPPGRYVITAEAGAEQARAVVEVVAGRDATAHLESRGTTSVIVTVRGARGGEGLVGASCNAAPVTSEPYSRTSSDDPTTGADGTVRMTVPVGEIDIRCLAAGAEGTTRVTVTADREHRVELEIEPR